MSPSKIGLILQCLEFTYGNKFRILPNNRPFLDALLGCPRFPMLSQGPPEPRQWHWWHRWQHLGTCVQLGSLASSSSTPDFTESQILQKLPGIAIYVPSRNCPKHGISLGSILSVINFKTHFKSFQQISPLHELFEKSCQHL